MDKIFLYDIHLFQNKEGKKKRKNAELEYSMGMVLEEERLAEVKRLLSSTNRSIRRIAAACGYANSNRLSHVFTQRYGMSMSAWRKSR